MNGNVNNDPISISYKSANLSTRLERSHRLGLDDDGGPGGGGGGDGYANVGGADGLGGTDVVVDVVGAGEVV